MMNQAGGRPDKEDLTQTAINKNTRKSVTSCRYNEAKRWKYYSKSIIRKLF